MKVGYIGGTAHAYLAKSHPEYAFTLLVRDENKAKPIKDKYPGTKFIFGSLDNEALVSEAAANADVVVRKSHTWRRIWSRADCIQTRQTPLTMSLEPMPSPRALKLATRLTSPGIGFIPPAHPF